MNLCAPTQKNKQSSFLDALYIPTRLRSAVSLFLLPRTKVGNRCNSITSDRDQAESDREKQLWRNWIFIRHSRAYKQDLGFRNNLILLMGFGLFVCMGVGMQREARSGAESQVPTSYSMTSTPRPARTPVIPAPQVVTNEFGKPVQIRAADPQSVLLGFCRNARASHCDPVELAWGVPQRSDVRYGVYRSFHDIRAIEILRDPRTRQWVAGDGLLPVRDFLANTRDMGPDRIPVRTR